MEIRDTEHGFVLKLLHEPKDILDDNIDVEVVLAGGERFTATFATLKNVESLMRGYRKTGECLSGKYFWAGEWIVIEDLKPESIRAVVTDMLKSGELFRAFGGPHQD